MPPDDWGQIYQDAGQQYGIDPNLLRSLTTTESGGDPNAVSEKGAKGLTQLMPATARSLGVDDPTDPAQAIPASARLLRENFDRYGDANMAIAAYHGGTNPANWGPKTQDYLRKVSNTYSQYQTPPTQPSAAPVPPAPQNDVTAKIEAARAAGYNDADIAAYLQKNPAYGTKFDAARKAGYTDDQIYGHLGLKVPAAKSAQEALAPDATPTQEAAPAQHGATGEWSDQAAPATPPGDGKPHTLSDVITGGSTPPPDQVEGGLGPWLERAGKGAAREIASTPGKIMEGLATLPDRNLYGEPMDPQLAGLHALDHVNSRGEPIRPGPSAAESGTFKTGKELATSGENLVPMTPAEQGSVAGQVGAGLGSVGTAVGGALLGGPAVPALQFGLTGAGETLDEAHQKGATPEQEQSAAGKSFALNAAAGTLDVEAALGKIVAPISRSSPGLVDWAATRLKQAAQSGIIFTGIGEAQQWLSAQINKDFDPKAQYDFDPKRAAADLITGSVLGAVRTPHPQEPGSEQTVLPPESGTGERIAPSLGPDNGGPIIENPPQPGANPLLAGPRPGTEPAPVRSSQDIIDYAKQNLPTLMPEVAAQDAGQAAPAPVKVADVKDALGVTHAEASEIAADHNENIQKTAEIDKAAAKVDPNPTEAQIDAGNYQKASVSVHGIPITIETPKGTQRTGTNPDGAPWAVTLQHSYGYIRGTEGADGDHVDTYIGPYPASKIAYVVDQIDPATGQYDEHKVVLGARTPDQATQIYDAGFSDGSGPTRRAALTEMSIPQFKEWIKNGDTKAPLNPNVGAVGGTAGSVQGSTDTGTAQVPVGSGEAVGQPAAEQGDIAAAIQGGVTDPNLLAAFMTKQRIDEANAQQPQQQAEAAPRRPTDLVEFLARQGGLKDFQGELRNLDAHKKFVPGHGMLVRTNGKGISMDYAREAALEAGYPVGDSVGSFLDALETNLRGTHVFSHQDSGEAAEWEQHRQQRRGAPVPTGYAEDELYHRAEQLGIELEGDEHPSDILDMVQERESMMAEPEAFENLADQFDHDIDAQLVHDLPQIADEIPWTDEDAHTTAETGTQPQTARGPPEAGGQQEDAAGATPDGENLRPDVAEGREPAASRTPASEQTEQGSQLVIPGGERSARQAAEAREDQGRGKIAPKVAQRSLDDGLFGRPPERELFDQKPAEAAKTGPQLTFAETTHTKTGAPLFVAKLDGERLPPDEYKALLAEAKKLGGYYSSFRGKGAIPGFQFKEKVKAEQFIREQSARGGAEKAPSQEPTSPSRPDTSPSRPSTDDYGTKNKIFTASAADRAREVLRAKLNQINSGFDPEIGLAGLTLAGYHIEAGARSFADYAKAMVDDLGHAVQPYLRSWYEAVRHHPGLDTKGMSTPEEIADELRDEPGVPTLNATEAGNGIQESLRSRDGSPGSEDVSGTGAEQENRPAPPGEEHRGARDAEGPAGGSAEGLDRRAEEPAGSVERGGDRAPDADRVSRTGERSEPGAAGRPAEERPDADVKGTNYRIEPGALEETRGPKTKARDNLAAIELAKRIISEDRLATKEDQAVLAKYVGWGGLSGAFPDSTGKRRAGFEDIGERLRRLLTPDEHEAAATSTQYAHYTSEPVVRAMWDAVREMGFDGGNIFEPGMGIGHFVGLMPDDIAAKSRYEGIERDPVSANIAKLLYPQSGVREADYIKTPMPDNTFDLVIGNPPFADTVIQADPKYRARGFMLHDYFFAKSLDSVRPGGLLAFITSAGTMNKMDEKARHFLAERAEFVGGVRLPGDAFSKNAGTSVTTDMLFFKRRPEGRIDIAPEQAPIWTQTVEKTLSNDKGEMIRGNVSRYFHDHPEQVLGKEGWTGGQYKNRYGVEQHPGTDLPTDLRLALERLPKDVMTPPLSPEDKAKVDFASGQKKDGSYYLGPDGKLMQYSAGAGREVGKRGAGVAGGMTTGDRDRIVHLIPIRDALRDVFSANLAEDVQGGDAARKVLNGHYDRFVKKFGPINKADFQYRRPTINQAEEARLEARQDALDAGDRFDDGDFDPQALIDKGSSVGEIARARKQARDTALAAGRTFDEGSFDPADMPDVVIEKRPNIAPFMADPESYRLRSIENYNDVTGEANKKPIFRENILRREQEPVINSANDGVLWSLNKHGRLDLDAIAEKLGTDRKTIIDDLGDSIYKAPGTDVYQTADEYLSGDIMSKIDVARAQMDRDPDMRRNLTALQAAMPAPLSPSEISVTIGMPWVPRETYQEFVNSHMRLGNPTIRHSAITGRWTVDDKAVRYGADRSGVASWSTPERDAYELLSDAMNRTPPKIYDVVKTPDGNRSVFNAVATQAAQDKMESIKQAFSDWVEGDPARNDGLAKIYNDNLNRSVLRKFDGSYLTTPGIVASWGWRPHQLRVIARIIQAGSTYMAHAVGAGKTSSAIGAAMEMRRLGLVNKPLIVVPNHMLSQFTKEFYEQYPTARIAVADERNFHTDHRKQFMANVAQDDLDAIIITHSSFGKIPISDEFQDHLVQEQLDQLAESMKELDPRDDRITIKNLKNMKEKLEQKLSARGTGKQDQTNTFEEMGVDFMFIDESHGFRKLSFASQQTGLKGITPQGSNMAWDLYTKARYLDSRKPGRSMVMMSGTPITNTMGELFSLSRYMQPKALESRGLAHFDSWAQTFGDTAVKLEAMPDGSYKPVTRFSKFVNLPELYKMVGEVMDIVTPNELEKYVTRPQIKGGERKLNIAPFTDNLAGYQHELASRMAAIAQRTGKVQKGDDIILSVINDGRHSAIDPRFVMAAGNDPDSKLNMMISNAAQIWRDTKDKQFYNPADGYKTPLDRGPAAQMIFANLGVNGRGPIGFSTYAWIKSALLREGVPADQIAFIGDYKDHAARQALFRDVNSGKKRILVGSTQKMGTGVNAQRRLYALHNLDPLWFPADDEQRVGRALRQGNTNPEIEIHDYTTKDTYDQTMWGMMGRKGRFIEQFFRGDPNLRDMEDLGEASAFEQAAAMSTSDPRLMQLTDMKQDLDKAERRANAHERDQYSLRQRLSHAVSNAQDYTNKVDMIHQDLAQRVPTSGDAFRMTIDGREYAKRKDAAKALEAAVTTGMAEMGKGAQRLIGKFGGFPLQLRKSPYNGEPEFTLIGKSGREINLRGDTSTGGEATIQSAEYRLRNLETDLDNTTHHLTEAEKEAASIRPLIGKEFKGGENIADLRQKIRALEAEMKPKEEAKNPGVAEDDRPFQAVATEGTRGENLKHFLEGSKAPAVLYHGVNVHAEPRGEISRPLGDIDQFDRLAAYKAFNRAEGMDAVGIWMSESPASFGPDQPVHGAGMYAGAERGAIYPVHASLKNPWKPRNFDEFLDKMHETAGRNPKKQNPRGRGSVDELRSWLESKGYDSIYFGPGEIDSSKAAPVWVALHPEQIKSAVGNRGTFDPTNRDITALPAVGEYAYRGEPAQEVYEIGPGVYGHLSPEVEDRLPRLVDDVTKIIAKIAPGAKGYAFQRIKSGDDALYGAYSAQTSKGLPHVIAWSLESPDMVGTAKHEAIHYLRQSGLLSEREWKTLADAAEKQGWLDSWDVAERWKGLGLDHDQMIEEAVAEQYAHWNGDYGTLLDPIFSKIHQFLGRVADVARRILGKSATADDIFNRIERGEVGGRAPGAGRESSVLFQPPPIDATPEEEREHAAGLIDRLAAPFKKLLSTAPAQKVVNGESARKARTALGSFYDDIAMKVAPISLGTDAARAAAKDFANEERRISYHLGQIDKMVATKYTPAERANMGAALDEQSVMDQVLQAPLIEKNREDRAEVLSSDMDTKERAGALSKLTKAYNKIRAMHAPLRNDRGLGRLPDDQRALAEMLDGMSQRAWKDMKDTGIVAGAGLPHYMPRYFVNLNDKGVASRIVKEGGISAIDPLGRNLRTSGPGRRKYMTTEETEAAARTALGDNASLVKDIRALLVSLQRSQRSIAGKELIRAVKTIGHETGAETVSDEAKPGFFTIDHPAFTEVGPALKMDEDGNMVPRMDDAGNMIMARRPIYVSREFEGPLRAVLNTESGAIYKALMNLKGKTMGIIMYSPLIHNAVEWGRALPAMPGKVATFRVYFDGYKAKNDPATMDEAITAGMSPIGHLGGVQDITGVVNDINITPGRSWTAQLLSAIPGLFDPKAGDAVKRAVDKAGDFWHNTLLWDRVADLQAGLYVNLRDAIYEIGTMDRLTAQRIAAHLANRYAGALPREAMSTAARKIANLTMFSRTFTMGNWGAMKDMVGGLPKDVQSQILRDSGMANLRSAQAFTKRKARATITLDVALMYVMGAVLSSSIAVLMGDETLGEEAHGYVRRLNKLLQTTKENPLSILDPFSSILNPFHDLNALSPMSENEPGKEDRTLVGYAKDGTAIYMRNPVGKLGEEFTGWMTQPLTMFSKKESTFLRPTLQLLSNDKGYGRKVYDPYANTTPEMMKNIGRIVSLYFGDQIPLQAIQAAKDALAGRGDASVNAAQVLGPVAGFTFSKGAPGGPAVGQMYRAEDVHKFQVNEAMPAIRQKITDGDIAGATKDMTALGMAPSLQKFYIRTTTNPQLRMTPSAQKAFRSYATPEQIEQMERSLVHH